MFITYLEEKPIKRSRIRLLFGEIYYSVKRYKQWYFSGKHYAKSIRVKLYPNILFTHSTPLLRKLKDVDMQLQYNKIINLKLAAKKLNGIVIKPGQTLSYWKLIGKTTYILDDVAYKSNCNGKVQT